MISLKIALFLQLFRLNQPSDMPLHYETGSLCGGNLMRQFFFIIRLIQSAYVVVLPRLGVSLSARKGGETR
ncbi:MAG: hypothetical protein CBB71_13135 [Rhodopirellula sp. TMED11]|nr:MAG: hypothetical protein CBB71_13135 [Rhodopirellula sp. TMED11]